MRRRQGRSSCGTGVSPVQPTATFNNLKVLHPCKRVFREQSWILFLSLALLLCGCSRLHSRAITLHLVNASPAPVSNLAFEFPGGSFGVDAIAPGAMRQKWFKPLSSGTLKVDFDDASGRHSAQLISLHAGDSGIVKATFSGNGHVAVTLTETR